MSGDFQTPGDATLPRITERLPDGSSKTLHEPPARPEYLPPSIEDAKELAEKCGVNQVVIYTFREGTGQHVSTYGTPMRHSLAAAEAGNYVKRVAGWPAPLTQALPQSLIEVFSSLDETIATEVAARRLHKGTVLAVLFALRDVISRRDRELGEGMVPAKTEATVQNWAAEPEAKGGV